MRERVVKVFVTMEKGLANGLVANEKGGNNRMAEIGK
jgi:hypothetical protein